MQTYPYQHSQYFDWLHHFAICYNTTLIQSCIWFVQPFQNMLCIWKYVFFHLYYNSSILYLLWKILENQKLGSMKNQKSGQLLWMSAYSMFSVLKINWSFYRLTIFRKEAQNIFLNLVCCVLGMCFVRKVKIWIKIVFEIRMYI